MGYTTHAIKGVSWMGAFRIATRGMSFLRTIIIARILSPSQFGLYGIAALVLTMIEILTETGINIILVQQKEGIEKYLNTAWVISICRGVIIAVAIFLSSFFVADFFKAPESLSLLMLVSVVPFLRGFINPAVATFQKQLLFHKEFSYRTSVFFVESIITIVFILWFRSPSALIWGLIAGAFFEVVISFLYIRPFPQFVFDRVIAKHIVSRGKWVTLAGVFQYFFQNGDNIVVGRMLGTGALGIYEMAYKMAMLPITEISDVITRVTFPMYVQIADDTRRLKRAYLKTTGIVALACIPLGLVFLLFPKEIVLLILGSKWVAAAPVFQVLAIVGVLQGIIGNAGAVYLAKHKQEYTTINTGVGVFVMAVLIIPFTYTFGLIGAGLAVIAGALVMLPVSIFFLIKLLK